MEQAQFLSGIVVFFTAAVLVSWGFRLLRLPSIIGFLVSGALIGPAGLQLFARAEVEVLTELGLVLLLFSAGLELAPANLMRTARPLLLATAAQFLGTTVLVLVALAFFGPTAALPALVLAVSVSLSSTAIVLKQLSDRGEMRSAGAMIATGMLLLQDVLFIGIMLALPLIAHTREADWGQAFLRSGLGLLALVLLFGAAYKLLPFVLSRLIRPAGREFLALFAVLMACTGAWLTGTLGWPLALGSCMAGLLLASTPVRHQLVADITPFREVFNALFFMSLGMLVAPAVVWEHLAVILSIVLALLLVKACVAAAAVKVAGWPLRPAVFVGIGLCTVSEFGFVLANEAYKLGILAEGALDLFIACTVGSMMLGSLFLPFADRLGIAAAHVFRFDTFAPKAMPGAEEGETLSQHLIVVGFGACGKNLARALRSGNIPYCVIEMNPKLIEDARAAGARVIVGDASRASVLEQAGLHLARGLVVAINDARATARIIAQARTLHPALYVLARASYLHELDGLYAIGASEVIPEDFEASIEMVAQILKRFGYADNIVEHEIGMVRASRYRMLRSEPEEHAVEKELMRALGAAVTATVYLPETSMACGKTLAQLHLRAKTGVTVIAVVRKAAPKANPPPGFHLEAGDVLVLLGNQEQLQEARTLLAQPAPDADAPASQA